MAESDGRRRGADDQVIQPGALTALLRQLVAAPTGADDSAWAAALRPGVTFGRFELIRELGRGGFGVVWEARDRELQRGVAFKAVRGGPIPAAREEQLLREAEVAARLSHPNIVTLLDVGRAEPGPFLVMELLQGQTLAARLRLGSLQPAEAVRVAARVAAALAHAHGQGVVHRDLKPENVFLCADGQVKVLDFGLAHAFGHRKADGGTPGYMAPEQAEGAPEDERTDVFALGVLLFEALSGRRPFGDGRAVRSGGKAPSLEVPGEPALGALVGRMLAKRPVDRPRDGAEVAAALEAIEEALQRSPSSSAGAVTTRRRPGLRLAGLVVAGGVAGALLAGGALLWRGRSSPHANPAPAGDGSVKVAVADFANETGDPELDALSGLLITSLEQSRALHVLTRSRMLDVLRQAGKGAVARIDEGLAIEAARREQVKVLLLPAVRRLGDRYVVDLRALDPAADRPSFTVRETTEAKAGLLTIVDRLADRTRAELRVDAGQPAADRPLAAGEVTRSLEAYQHYALGEQRYDESRVADALQEYRKALAIDPGFALAHYGISRCMLTTQAPDSDRRAHADAAAAAAGRLPAKEALLVRAWQARSYFRTEDAWALYAQAMKRFPEDKDVLLWTGNMLANLGGDPERLVEISQRVLRLDPASRRGRMYLVIGLTRLGRLDEAAALLRRWEAEGTLPGASCSLVSVEMARRDLDAALNAARRCAAAPPVRPGDRVRLFWVHQFREEPGSAAAELLRRRQSGEPQVDLEAWLASSQGRQREAERLARDPKRSQPLEDELVKILAARGPSAELSAALEAMSTHSRKWDGRAGWILLAAGAFDPATIRDSGYLDEWTTALLEALERRARGDLAGARARLVAQAAAKEADRMALTYALAQTCHLAEDARCVLEAAEAYRLAGNWVTGDFFWRTWGWPRLLLWSAVAHQRLGERDQARGKVERLLRLWKDADADLPHLAEAKALCRELACRP